ncbi:MAG: N-acetylglucosamine-6-phosphate deacetylase [Lentisphaeria bacterium]|nr:N-acetylglucosamine-6-phosphate deacetylase [Lentisphaeria bacterium]
MISVINNCRIISPGSDIPSGNIVIEDGVISYAGSGTAAVKTGNVIDGSGLIAVPGFIDIHSHGRSNFDFCDGSEESFAVIGRGKLEDGVTGFLATSLSVSTEDLRNLCRQAEHYKKNVSDGSTMLGIHLEGPFFNPKCAGAQNPDFLKNPDIALVDELNAISPVKKVSFSPELPGGEEFTKALTDRGIMASGGHTEADYERYTRCRELGMKHLTHFCNVMTPMHHLRFGMVGGGLLDDDVYVEMICDGVHLCDQMIRMIARMKGPEKMMLITDAMRASAMPDGEYTLGGLPVIVKDGCARLTTGPVAGSTLRYHNGLKHLIKLTGLPLCEAIRATSFNQAESLGLGKRGKLEKGFIADIALLDNNLDVQKTICSGIVKWEKK